MDSDWNYSPEACPLKAGAYDNLDKEEIVAILEDIKSNPDLLSTSPPVLPQEGEVYAFDLGEEDPEKKK